MNDEPRRWILGLRPSGHDRPPAAAPEAGAVARDLLGEGPIGWAVETAAQMTAEVIGQVPPYGGGRAPFETLRRSVEASVLVALVGLYLDLRPTPELIPVEAIEGNADLVHRGVALDQVLRGVRIGHADLHQRLMDAIDAEPEPVRLAESHRVSELLFSYADAHASRMAEEYISERARWQASSEAARRQFVEDVLAGRRGDLERVGRRLGYELSRHHLAFIVVADDLGTPADALRRFASEAARAVGGQELLTVQSDASTLWAWTARATSDEPDLDIHVPPGLRLALGSPGFGITGFQRSHRGAVETVRFLNGQSVCRYADVRVRAILAAAGEQARWLAEEILGVLIGDDEWSGQLRETLRVYLASGRSPQHAAELLHVSRNTVTYRIRRAEELLGHPLTGDLLELRLALEIARTPAEGRAPEA